MLILAVETSCDETSAAVLRDGLVLSNVISSQLFHNRYGGVVPEMASREHTKNIVLITKKALSDAGVKLEDIDAVSATTSPGLIGALLVGMNFAKALAFSLGIPFIPVNHIHAHLYSNFLDGEKPPFPFLSLIVSGGHTILIKADDYFRHEILGKTLDDAAGEAFDKVAKMLGLPYPGGPEIDRLAKTGREDFHAFPISRTKDNPFDFSFSGIKTSVLYYLRDIGFKEMDGAEKQKLTADIAASFQKTMVDTLFGRVMLASKKYGIKNIAVAGGVSANSALKRKFEDLEKKGYQIFIPPPAYTTDNAAMIGLAAYYEYMNSKDRQYFEEDSFAVNASPRLDYENF